MTTGYARGERTALADSLLAAGPDAPTLCDGWTTRDLAAHLVLRERNPVAAGGIVIRPLAGLTEQVQRRIARGDYTELVDKVRHRAWWSPLRVDTLDDAMNAVEFFIHHEDVRRAQPGWEPRELPEDHETALYRRLSATARLTARRFPATVVVTARGRAPFEVGAGGDRVVVRGDVGELVMFFAGRQRAANVEIDGPDPLVARLRGARLGI